MTLRPLILRSLSLLLPGVLAGATMLQAQDWNSAAALDLARSGAEVRDRALADSSLTSYHTTARGFVFFQAQVGEEGLREPPRLVKADQLVVEVYWRAPNQSKQVVIGWRDGNYLPTDISYHRDHLGIVTNNFGEQIRIGEGDEVRDVPHPLSARGLDLYDFALTDSLTVQGAGGTVRLRALSVRPKDFGAPRVVGTLFLDMATSQLVRFRFSFTPAAYLDSQLEDISITLESANWEGRYWLPWRQSIEIRRRFSWLDFPARGIIRGRWEIGDYEFNVPLPDQLFTGFSIAGLRQPGGPDSLFHEPIDEAVEGVSRPLEAEEMAALRADVERIAGATLLSGLPTSRIGGGGVSDLVKVNRVQGLALGARAVVGLGRNRIQLRPAIGIGTSDERVTGGLELRVGQGATQVSALARRTVADVGDVPVIAPALNSILAQEFGKDYGDYYQLDEARLAVRQRLGGRHAVELGGGRVRARPLEIRYQPAHGTYRPNPALGGVGAYSVGRLLVERGGRGGVATTGDVTGSVALEGGTGPTDYLRASLEAELTYPLGGSEVLVALRGGTASAGLPDYRSFVLGGRSTLVGEPFRAFGGRHMALGRVEWRFQAPVPAIPLGSFASTGREMTVAPFFAAGWADGRIDGQTDGRMVPWTDSDGVRPVAGVALELFMQLIRVEAGVALRTGEVGFTVDINREWWGAL